MIAVAQAPEVIRLARTSLGLDASTEIDDVYLAASLRRLAGFLCPCSPKTLLGSMLESHRGLTGDPEVFAGHVEEMIDALVAIGDLLELRDVSTLEETVKATWVFAAPPSFVRHASGSVFILGLTTDESSPLPADLLQRLRLRGATRQIEAVGGEDIAAQLGGLGFRQLSMEAWLRHPRQESAKSLVASLDSRLNRQGPSGEISELRVIDSARSARRYRDRWRQPGSLDGRFVVRRPQAYGADLWGYAALADGRPTGLIDFPTPGSRWRGCDIAWRSQMAIDALNNNHQSYRVRMSNSVGVFDFFSPIPDWARRRLAAVGTQVEASSSLLSFRVNQEEVATEERFLQDYLFLQRE